nr:MAG TPA: hypothetical protein [Caudoviricetes sp.]
MQSISRIGTSDGNHEKDRKILQSPLDRHGKTCYCMRNGLDNPSNSGGRRRHW